MTQEEHIMLADMDTSHYDKEAYIELHLAKQRELQIIDATFAELEFLREENLERYDNKINTLLDSER